MNALQNDLYYDSHPPSRSPRSSQNFSQTVRSQNSRQFEQYAHVPAGLFAPDEQAAPRFDPPRYGDRPNSTLHGGFGGYEMGAGPQGWNSAGYGHGNTLAALGATTRYRPTQRNRGTLPDAWLDPSQGFPHMGGYQAIGGPGMGMHHMRQDPHGGDLDEDLIPTAIVIKNIPFAVKKEQLQDVMKDMNLPLPYAFNYHFDNGVFRGLAFANFTTPEETAAVIEAMNHLDLQGRKLRVEYKKMLPQAERERIEREKRERRGQLEEQHRPMATPALQTQPSGSSLSSHFPGPSPSPIQARAGDLNLDMNNPTTLAYYTKLVSFSESGQEILAFPPTTSPEHRRMIHTLAHMLGLGHSSTGTGPQRQVHVFKNADANGLSPIMPTSINPLDASRRSLNRAATTDFADVKASENGFYNTLNKQGSGFLGFQDSHGNLPTGANLRAAKSFADLRSYTPSPAASNASFPANSRWAGYNPGSPGSTRTNITPTTTAMPADSMLVNTFNSMDLNNGTVQGGNSPRRLRGMMSWDDQPAPIGSNRGYNSSYDDPARNRGQAGAPLRQPRGPIPDRGSGFSRPRQNGHQARSSDDLSPPAAAELINAQ